ncbi:uncharacterized protein LOC108701160 [Xenopus laevis]|uniref:Uncharacterized protein n=2 Tax=Xenopus laevis TaxID=8355 RepID=A0A974BXY8_XENLA|nr:uncharacterized protein LOC108701160 [Xenopus laevis]OCT63058.1 hypothetical protein XELAEV_18044153mg [Xenopus laevis]
MPQCIISDCPNYCSRKNISLHVFPKNLAQIKLWLLQTGQDYGDLDSFAQRIYVGNKNGAFRLCSDHFAPECYYGEGPQKQLVNNAVPTLFPKRKGENVCYPIHGNLPPSYRPRPKVDATTNTDEVQKRDISTRTDLYHKVRSIGTRTDPRFGVRNVGTLMNSTCLKRNASTSTLIIPILTTIDRGVQVPECTHNTGGETWKVQHDHIYEFPSSELLQSPRNWPITPRPGGITNSQSYVGSSGLNQDNPPKAPAHPALKEEYTEDEMMTIMRRVTNILKNDRCKHLRTQRMMKQALEIVNLLTTGDCIIMKKYTANQNIPLVTGEVPVKSGDVAMYFSAAEWEYIGKHWKHYRHLIERDSSNSDVIRSVPAKSMPRDAPLRWNVVEDSCTATLSLNVEQDTKFLYPENTLKLDSSHESTINMQSLKKPSLLQNVVKNWVVTKISCGNEKGTLEDCLTVCPSPQPPHTGDGSYSSNSFEDESKPTLNTAKISFSSEKAPVGNVENHTAQPDGPYSSEMYSSCIKGNPQGTHPRAKNSINISLKCKQCSKMFHYKAQLLKHQKKHRGKMPYTCHECGTDFQLHSHFLLHRKQRPCQKKYTCNGCGIRFGYKCNLVVHQKTHARSSPYVCAQCQKKFHTRTWFMKHMKSHKRKNLLNCSHCEKWFVSEKSLAEHQSTHMA